MWPGLLVQMITTKQPTDEMIEVAIVALEEALMADGEPVPADGLNLARSPMPAPGVTAAKVRAAEAAETTAEAAETTTADTAAAEDSAAIPALADPPVA